MRHPPRPRARRRSTVSSTRPPARRPAAVAPYNGILKKITAPDRLTVEFQLCAPDVAFLPKIAFASFAIQDADYLAAHRRRPDDPHRAERHGPVQAQDVGPRQPVIFEAFDGYWGTKALTPNLELRWSDTSAQRLIELQSGTIDGMDNPGIEEIPTIKGDSSLVFLPREP